MSQVTLYGKPGCHLCDEAREVVLAVRRGREFELEEVDVSADARLHAQLGELIPVLEVGGERVAHHFISAAELEAALDRVAG